MSDAALAIELYASSVVAARHCYGRMGEHVPPLDELDHVGECIVHASDDPTLAIALALAPSESDDASRAVQSAFIAARVAHAAGASADDRTAAVLAALYVDAGRARLASASSLDLSVFSELPDSLDHLAPAATVAAAITGTRPTLRQWAALTAFEVAWLERPRLGPLYRGELAPRLMARVLVACRALLSRVAPRTHDVGVSPFSALRALCTQPEADRVALGLLASAVGHLPVGTVVEVTGGHWAVVGPDVSPDPKRPRLRGLDGASLDAESPSIVRVIEPKSARFSVAFALANPAG
ncbi:MAG: hypothetical protein IT375_30605 [Polyangiaceae bacterium]|nr:hypothetical protein [Polyangiaceae bacterium]